MFKLLIVEDNQIVQRGLCENVNWEEQGIELIEAVSNGRKALEAVMREKPDLILTDVVMPVMNGLELVEKVHGKYPEIKLIIISAHDDYEYLQKALKHHVFDYVLKPIIYKDVLATVNRAILEVRDEKKLRERIQKSTPVLKEKLFKKMLNDEIDMTQLLEEAEYLNINFKCESYICILLKLQLGKCSNEGEDRIGDRYMDELKLLDLIASAFPEKMLLFSSTVKNEMPVLFGWNEEDSGVSAALQDSLIKIKEEIEKKETVVLSVGVGGIVKSMDEISSSYRQASDALDYAFVFSKDEIIRAVDINHGRSYLSYHFPVKIEIELLRNLRIMNTEGLFSSFLQLRNYFKNNRAVKEYVIVILCGIIAKALQVLFESGIDIEPSLGTILLAEMNELHDLAETMAWTEKTFNDYIKLLKGTKQRPHKDLVIRAKQYIEENLGMQGLGLSCIAGASRVSPSYLSTIFKKETETNLTDFINLTRIEKAQELLRQTDLLIYEIAEKLGYNNQYYFSAMFKKLTGISPKDFRNTESAS